MHSLPGEGNGLQSIQIYLTHPKQFFLINESLTLNGGEPHKFIIKHPQIYNSLLNTIINETAAGI